MIHTRDQEIINITSEVEKMIKESKLQTGLINLSILHTSASLFVQENASEDVLLDISDFINTLVPQSSKYRHDLEGPDDMPARDVIPLDTYNNKIEWLHNSSLKNSMAYAFSAYLDLIQWHELTTIPSNLCLSTKEK